MHGSLRPTLGELLTTGDCGGGQQLVLVQVDFSGATEVSDKLF
ncbi:hypothetical protein [Paraglaciecola sp. 2405UD69-4]